MNIILRLKLGSLAVILALFGPLATAATATPVSAAAVTQMSNFFGWCGGKTPLQEIQPDATPNAVPATCSNYTGSNGTIVVQLAAAAGSLTVSEYVINTGTRPGSVVLIINGNAVVPTVQIPPNTAGWLVFPAVSVQTADVVATRTATDWTGTGQVKVYSVHGELSDPVPPTSAVPASAVTQMNN